MAPADGPPGDPIFLRWEHTTPPHRKFYEVEVEMSLFFPKVLVRRWGRIGTRRVRSLKVLVASADEVREQVAVVGRRRERHGYQQVAEVRVPAIGAEAA